MHTYHYKTSVGEVINQLNELNDIYDGIEFNYQYKMASTH